MKNICNNCLHKNTCKIINSCKERGYNKCSYYKLNENDNKENNLLISFENMAKPLIEWLCKNEHLNVTAIITPTSCELLENKCGNTKIHDYIK